MTASRNNAILTLIIGLSMLINGCQAAGPVPAAWQLQGSYVVYSCYPGPSTLMVITPGEATSAEQAIESGAASSRNVSDLMRTLGATPTTFAALPAAVQSIANGILNPAWATFSFMVMPDGAGNLLKLMGQGRTS